VSWEGAVPASLARAALQAAAALEQPVALTGATGFVGSHLLEVLRGSGCRVRVLARDPGKLPPGVEEVAVGDLEDEQVLATLVSGCATVLHVAGLVRASREELFFAANAAGTAKLVEAASRAGRPRLVYVSSLAAAGPSPTPQGKAPEDPAMPISAYGRSKLAGEQAVRSYTGPWVILRPPAIYGPRDRDVFTFFQLASRGFVPFPRGERYLTVAFVGDVVLAILRAAVADVVGKVLHLGEPEPYAMGRLLELLIAAGEVRARRVPLPGWVFRLAGIVGDGLHVLGFRQVAMTSDKARELLARHWAARTAESLAALGVPPPVTFFQGARYSWGWYRQEGWLPRVRM